MFPLNFGRDDEDYQIALGNNGQVTSEIFIFFFVWKIILEFGKEREDPRYNSACICVGRNRWISGLYREQRRFNGIEAVAARLSSQ